MTNQTAVHDRLAKLTDQWIELFDHWVPVLVSDPQQEYDAIRRSAGLMDFSMLRTIDVIGTGAIDLINTVVTRDVGGLRPGQIMYTALCEDDGKMLDDCTVMAVTPTHVRVCGARDRDTEILSEKAKSANIKVRDITSEMAHLCVQGPASREILAPLASIDLASQTFPYYTLREDVTIAGIPVFMTRLGYTAELGYELWVDNGQAGRLWDLLMEAGKPHGMKPVGVAALTLIRIEGGLLLADVEYDSTTSPFECGLGWSVSLEKEEFQGRAALIKDKETSRRRIASVVLESGGDEASGAVLYSDGAEVGRITQAIFSPYLAGRTLGLAEIDKNFKRPGTPVEARFGDAVVRGETVPHPVYDPYRSRAKLS